MNLGKAIRTCRMKRGLSQATLAQRAGCSISYLSVLEDAKCDPSMLTVKSIATALGVPLEIVFFLGAEESELAAIGKGTAGQLAHAALVLLDKALAE